MNLTDKSHSLRQNGNRLIAGALTGAHVGSLMLLCAYGGLQTLGRSCTPARSSSDGQSGARPWQNRAAVHHHAFLWPAPWDAGLPPHRPKHCWASLTGTIHSSRFADRLVTSADVHLPSDRIKKSSPLSGSSWPRCTKCPLSGWVAPGSSGLQPWSEVQWHLLFCYNSTSSWFSLTFIGLFTFKKGNYLSWKFTVMFVKDR